MGVYLNVYVISNVREKSIFFLSLPDITEFALRIFHGLG